MANERPTISVQLWAEDELYTTGPLPGQPTKITPGAGQAQEGYVPGYQYPAEFKNYNQNLDAQWIRYFEKATSPAGAIDHFAWVSNDVTLPNNVEATRMYSQHYGMFLFEGAFGGLYANSTGAGAVTLLSNVPGGDEGSAQSFDEDVEGGVFMYAMENQTGASDVFATTNGTTWFNAGGITNNENIGICFSGNAWIIWADDNAEEILRSTDNGSSWLASTYPWAGSYMGMSAAVAHNTVFAVRSGTNDDFAISDDNAQTWTYGNIPGANLNGGGFYDEVLDAFLVWGSDGGGSAVWAVDRLSYAVTKYALPGAPIGFAGIISVTAIRGDWFIELSSNAVGEGFYSTADRGVTFKNIPGSTTQPVRFAGTFFWQNSYGNDYGIRITPSVTL